MGLYEDGFEFEKGLREAIRMHATSSPASWILVVSCQFGEDIKAMYEKDESSLYSDIN